MLKVLQVSCDAYISQKSVQADKIFIGGTLRLNILYIPDGDVIGKVKSIMTTQDFSHSADIKGAKPGMNLSAEAECETPEYTLVNSRKLNIRCKVGFGIKLTAPCEADIATDIDGDDAVQIKGTHIKVCNSCLEAERDIIIREQLDVPAGNPSIGEILKISAKPTLTELRIIDNKAIVKGEMKICTLYCGDDDECSIQCMEHVLPFTEIPEAEGLSEGMSGELDFCVKNLFHEIRQDSDGDNRILGIEATLGATVKASETIEFDAIEDAYGLEGEVNLTRRQHNIEQLIDCVFAQCALKEPVSVPDYLPEPHRICDCTAVPDIESISIEDGSVTVRGFVNTSILYLSSESDTPIAGFCHTTPFSHTFEIPEIRKNSVCDAKSDIEHLSCTMKGARDIELRIIVSVGLKAVSPGECELVDEIELSDSPIAKLPSMIVYFVREGDTLWSIAKRYRTTPDAIISFNGPEKDLLKAGNRIYIFR